MSEHDKETKAGGKDRPEQEHERTEAVIDEQANQAEAADPWAEALAEQGADDEAAEPDADGDAVFQPLESSDPQPSNTRDLETILDIPMRLDVELGRTRLTIKELLELTEGSIVELDGFAGDPMDIMINGHLVAQGEVVVVDDKYGIRITDIITASERAQKLKR